MSVGIIVGLLLVLVVVAWALWPLFRARPASRPEVTSGDQRLEELLFERESTLNALRDLQLDHAMGKLSEADFAEMDSRLRSRAVVLMQELDKLGVPGEAVQSEGALDAWIERAVAQARGGGAPSARTAEAEHAEPDMLRFPKEASAP